MPPSHFGANRIFQQSINAQIVARASARQSIEDRQVSIDMLLNDSGAAGPLDTVATNTVDAINEVRALAMAGGGGGGGAGAGVIDLGNSGGSGTALIDMGLSL
jgi:ABC-type methionine transport system permease subunit